MLSARSDGQTIIVPEPQWETREDWLREASREGRLLAPCCGARLVLKWGTRKVRHFAHVPHTDCPYDRWSEPESAEHMAGKLLLYQWCRRHYGETARVVALEHPLPETLQRPDVYLELADGTRYALEYQRSPISPGEWMERHQAYQSQSIHDIWIFGENRLADALPSEEQLERWSAREPHMRFLKLRAAESEAAVQTPYEVAWWRGDQQEGLWGSLELDARVGREINPWYNRSALQRLRSIIFLDAGTGVLSIYRAMRELPGHVDTKMASVLLQASLDTPGLRLEPTGFALPADTERLANHQRRVARVEAAARPALAVQETPTAYTPSPAEQEEEQRRRLADRATLPEWRKIVDRFGLTPANLHFLVGVPIPDDTVIAVHRTVWQAFVYYRLLWEPRRHSLSTSEVTGLLERTFGFDEEMNRTARYRLPGEVNAPEDVVGRFLLLLADSGYLRSDRGTEHLRFYLPESPPPPLAFADRQERWHAWEGLLARRLRRAGDRLVGEGGPVQLVQPTLADNPTPAQVEAVARLASRLGLTLDLASLTYTEASRILSEARRPRP